MLGTYLNSRPRTRLHSRSNGESTSRTIENTRNKKPIVRS
ncbi:hypothetical protein FOTG_19098 [Fusarium oxysporum f. sp. vasinfectum 25433]|uniref:Uncharacterized protein n=1 Tax=Fusarium oxysporum f. sp. vasinfectum 25433 TaxID=1089449 RepID=X0KUQ4_FUSOX|nr:hypothetical protein FOTG_19098 [Fusarium oxysporum f. sp. vasinfectum 25433]